jgi:hypothetical protein
VSDTKDWILLTLGSGGVAATWFKPIRDFLTERTVGRQRKTTDLVTALNDSRQRTDDENEYLREVSTYWQELAADRAALLRENGITPPAAHPPKRKERVRD